MTHDEIYTKFLIEYDKANVTSSYPSLTEYEVFTLLDKAYLALISRKLTGNNTRNIPFEYDTKSIEDLRSLINTSLLTKDNKKGLVSNEYCYKMDVNGETIMYFLEGVVKYSNNKKDNVVLVNHKIAQKFKSTTSNIPWIKTPVVYLEGNLIHLFIDGYKYHNAPDLYATYIKEPKKFVGESKSTKFELSDTVAEELINLAIVFALENVESSRLQTKLSTLPIEG